MISIDKEKRVNWHKIRAEYINGVSQRGLAEKYGLSRTIIADHCKRGNWSEAREKAKAEITQNIIQKTAEKVADNATLAADIRRKGLLILDRLFDDYMNVTATEHRESVAGKTDIKRLRDLTNAYRDLTVDITSNDMDKNAPVYELLRRLDNECGV